MKASANGVRVGITGLGVHVPERVLDNEELSRLVDTTDALGVVTHRAYDSFGNLLGQTRAAGTPEARATDEYKEAI